MRETVGQLFARHVAENEETGPDQVQAVRQVSELLNKARQLERENEELRKQLDRYTRRSESGESLGDALDMAEELEQARRTAEYWKAEHLAGNKQLEQAEARCKHYETALEKCFPILENMRAIIMSESR